MKKIFLSTLFVLVLTLLAVVSSQAQACMTMYQIQVNDFEPVYAGTEFPIVLFRQGDLTQNASYTLTIPPGIYMSHGSEDCMEGKGCAITQNLLATPLPSPYCSWQKSYEWVKSAKPGTYKLEAVFEENGSNIHITKYLEVLPPLELKTDALWWVINPDQSVDAEFTIINHSEQSINYQSFLSPDTDSSWMQGVELNDTLEPGASMTLPIHIQPNHLGTRMLQWLVWDETFDTLQSKLLEVHVFPPPAITWMTEGVAPGEELTITGNFLKLPINVPLSQYQLQFWNENLLVAEQTCEVMTCSFNTITATAPKELSYSTYYWVKFIGPHGEAVYPMGCSAIGPHVSLTGPTEIVVTPDSGTQNLKFSAISNGDRDAFVYPWVKTNLPGPIGVSMMWTALVPGEVFEFTVSFLTAGLEPGIYFLDFSVNVYEGESHLNPLFQSETISMKVIVADEIIVPTEEFQVFLPLITH